MTKDKVYIAYSETPLELPLMLEGYYVVDVADLASVDSELSSKIIGEVPRAQVLYYQRQAQRHSTLCVGCFYIDAFSIFETEELFLAGQTKCFYEFKALNNDYLIRVRKDQCRVRPNLSKPFSI